jgi:hypothetical protein
MFNDYIIANHRIRLAGSVCDAVKAGLRGFAPFVVEPEAEADCTATILTGVDIQLPTQLEQLTEFDFDEGDARCTFYRNAERYYFTIESDTQPTLILSSSRNDVSHIDMNAKEGVNPSFLRFGLWFAVNMALSQHLTTAVHTSVIVCHDEAIMFLGESGTGKSTHTRLWRENIEGATLLNQMRLYLQVLASVAEIITVFCYLRTVKKLFMRAI